MFGNTGKQLKIVGKEVLCIFKSLRDDIRQEMNIQKQLKTYRKELISKQNSSEDATTHAHEEAQN